MPLPNRGLGIFPPPPSFPKMPLGFRQGTSSGGTIRPTGFGAPSPPPTITAPPRQAPPLPFRGIGAAPPSGTRGIVRPTGFEQPPQEFVPQPPEGIVPPPPTIYDDPTKPPPVPAAPGMKWIWDPENWMWVQVEDIPSPPNPFEEAGPRPEAPEGFEYVWDPVEEQWVLQPIAAEPSQPPTPPPTPPAGSITEEEYAALLAVRPDPKPTKPPRAGFDWVLTTHTWTVLVKVPVRDTNGVIIPNQYDYIPQNYYTYSWDEVDVGETEEERIRREEGIKRADTQTQWEQTQREKEFQFEQEQALWQRGQAGQTERWNFIMMLLSAWPRLSLAGRSAVRDLVTRMGFNFDDILARMGLSEEITQPGMARFAPAGQFTER